MKIKKIDLYTLKKPCTFLGAKYTREDIDAGVVLKITEEQAQVLKDQGVIEPKED